MAYTFKYKSDMVEVFCIGIRESKDYVPKQLHTLYVSTGINETWSNHITPAWVVVNCSLELGLVAFATNKNSILVQFETLEALQK